MIAPFIFAVIAAILSRTILSLAFQPVPDSCMIESAELPSSSFITEVPSNTIAASPGVIPSPTPAPAATLLLYGTAAQQLHGIAVQLHGIAAQLHGFPHL